MGGKAGSLIAGFMKAVEVLKQRKRMSLEEFVSAMGYEKYDRHYFISVAIPRAIARTADEQTKKCFKLMRDAFTMEYHVMWICDE